MHGIISDKVYSNEGNPDVVGLVDRAAVRVLDVGCGSGANAALLQQRDPAKRIYGITGSPAEAELAGQHMERCWVADLEQDLPDELRALRFDCIVLSHVLEHLREPADLLARLVALLEPGAACVIAVPNVLYWRERVAFLQGKFEYQASGTLDETHLRFFTFFTAAHYLLGKTDQLRLVEQRVTGSVPLWFLRRPRVLQPLAERADRLGCAKFPNLFGSQILIKAQRAS